MTLAGRNAIITGASQGLGAEIARRLVAAGVSVLLCARGAETLEVVRAELTTLAAPQQRVLAQAADIASPLDVAALFALAEAAFPRLDILVNNAGIHGPIGRFEETSLDAWGKALSVNLLGTARCCQAALPGMRRAGGGKIINLAGGGATSPMPGMSAYAASKAALVRLTETLALENADAGIDINAVAPGAMATRLIDEVVAAGPERVGIEYHARMVKLRDEGGTPLSVGAELCVFLASAASDGITGKLISAPWDRWRDWPAHLDELRRSDVFTLRRITGRERAMPWGDA